MKKKVTRGFTLIELLIVVAIIAILAAIAVPNFLEAQTRAKVSRAKADMRTLAVAMESYYVDYNRYALNAPAAPRYGLIVLSSPVAYITSALLPDPFIPPSATTLMGGSGPPPFAIGPDGHAYLYSLRGPNGTTLDTGIGGLIAGQVGKWWLIRSIGPDMDSDAFTSAITNNLVTDVVNKIYDPTNGTRSDGNIYRTSGAPDQEAGRTLVTMTSR